MPYVQNALGVTNHVVAADVTNTSTFTIAYPTGKTQASYTGGLLNTNGCYAIVNKNDKFNCFGASGARFNITTVGASNITITNNTGATIKAGTLIDFNLDQVDDQMGVVTLQFAINLASITGAQDVVTNFQPGIAGTIEDLQWVQNVVVTTASKLASLNATIDGTDVTGGVVALTSAGCTPMGVVIGSTAITGGNTLNVDSKLRIKATAVTAFVEGSGTLLVRIRKTAQ